MGIYIKGMKMPSSCDKCKANYDCYCCSLISGDDGYFFRNEGLDTSLNRLPNCPLVEVPSHGRLIDADRLFAITADALDEYSELDNGLHSEKWCGWSEAEDMIANAPTVIEAEE